MQAIRLQSLISGYTGRPAVVSAMLNSESGRCIVGRLDHVLVDDFTPDSGCVLITDDRRLDDIDYFFHEEQIVPAISSFFRMQNNGLLEMRSSVQSCNPSNAIEREGIVNGKTAYRVMPSISNEQIASLAIISFSESNQETEQALDFMDDFSEIDSVLSGMISTI